MPWFRKQNNQQNHGQKSELNLITSSPSPVPKKNTTTTPHPERIRRARTQDWLLSVYLVAQGPVAGATFPLQTPLTLHHPEVPWLSLGAGEG